MCAHSQLWQRCGAQPTLTHIRACRPPQSILHSSAQLVATQIQLGSHSQLWRNALARSSSIRNNEPYCYLQLRLCLVAHHILVEDLRDFRIVRPCCDIVYLQGHGDRMRVHDLEETCHRFLPMHLGKFKYEGHAHTANPLHIAIAITLPPLYIH